MATAVLPTAVGPVIITRNGKLLGEPEATILYQGLVEFQE